MTHPSPTPSARSLFTSSESLTSWVTARLPLALAVAAPVYILWQVLHVSRLQTLDYWHSISSLLGPGYITWDGLIEASSEHHIVLPKLVYLANLALFGGSNRSLALFVFALSLTQAALLWTALPVNLKRDPVRRALALAVIAVFSFVPTAAHNYFKAMSGTCWFMANVLCLASLLAFDRGRLASGILLAVLGSISYSTSLVVWPVAAIVLWIAGRRRPAALLLAACAVVALVYALRYRQLGGIGPALDVVGIGRLVASFVGGLVSNDDTSVFLGVVGVAALGWECVRRTRRRLAVSPFWIGVACFALLNLLLIALARLEMMDTGPEILPSRYASLPALFWAAAIVIALSANEPVPFVQVLAGLLPAVVFLQGYPAVMAMRHHTNELEVSSIAVRLGAPPSDLEPYVISEWFGMLASRLQAVGHYPFNDDFPYGCRLVGSAIRPESTRVEPGLRAAFDECRPRKDGATARISGWVAIPRGELRCVVALDDQYRVVGAAVPGQRRYDVDLALNVPRANFGWEGVASVPAEGGVRVGVARTDRDGFIVLPAASPDGRRLPCR